MAAHGPRRAAGEGGPGTGETAPRVPVDVVARDFNVFADKLDV